MNLFTKYGIKEVANVMIYSIIRIGDEEFYMPVLFLDTLKISNIEKKELKVVASSGYGNTKVIGWSFGKDITLKMQDALFTPASLSMCWGGWLEGKMQCAALAMAKIGIRNKYKDKNYSIYAYPSPELTPEEWDMIYNEGEDLGVYVDGCYLKDKEDIEKNRVELRKSYYRKIFNEDMEKFWLSINSKLIKAIYLQKYQINTKLINTEFIDRIELCNSEDKEIIISCEEQEEVYKKYIELDYTSSFVLFLDSKNFLPLYIQAQQENGTLVIKPNTRYIKLTRLRYISKEISNSPYGKELIISCDTFPGYYRIVGETKIREQRTGLDLYLQFIIPKSKLSGDTNIKLEAAGEPTVFDMNIDVICPENDIMFEIKEFEVEKDCTHGGTHLIPQIAEYSYTPVYLLTGAIEETDIDDNVEIY